jgi:RHH-type rel operon transcriptional repressor/antitoxin RelB
MTTSIRLAPEIEQKLNFLVGQTGRTKSQHVREFIEQGLEDMEDYFLAFKVVDRVRNGVEPVHSAAAVRSDLGLGG